MLLGLHATQNDRDATIIYRPRASVHKRSVPEVCTQCSKVCTDTYPVRRRYIHNAVICGRTMTRLKEQPRDAGDDPACLALLNYMYIYCCGVARDHLNY